MNRVLLVLGVVSASLVNSAAWALPSVYDSFDYNADVPLDGMEGGYGWAGPWVESGGDPEAAEFVSSPDPTSLDLPNLPFTPNGGRAIATGSGAGGNNNYLLRDMSTTFPMNDENSFYVSYLMQKTGGDLATANNQEVDLQSVTGATIVRMGSTSGNNFFLGVASNTIPGLTLTYGETYFVVLKVDAVASGTDTLSAIVFDASEPIPAVEPATFDVTHGTASDAIIGGVRLWIGTNASGVYDELRFGNSWEDVTSANPNYILGDFNESGAIDPGDYTVLSNNLYTGTSYFDGDINFNGVVDLEDFAIFRDIYTAAGFSIGHGIQVPEPATALIISGFGLAAPIWLRLRRSGS